MAVSSVRGILHAVTLARPVMEPSPHVLLVADGAERFAPEIGMDEHDLLTGEAASRWREGLAHRHPDVDPHSIAGRAVAGQVLLPESCRRLYLGGYAIGHLAPVEAVGSMAGDELQRALVIALHQRLSHRQRMVAGVVGSRFAG